MAVPGPRDAIRVFDKEKTYPLAASHCYNAATDRFFPDGR